MTEKEGLGQGSEKALTVRRETKHRYHDPSAGRWHQALLWDSACGQRWEEGCREVCRGHPLPTQAAESLPAGRVVSEPLASGLQDVATVP